MKIRLYRLAIFLIYIGMTLTFGLIGFGVALLLHIATREKR